MKAGIQKLRSGLSPAEEIASWQRKQHKRKVSPTGSPNGIRFDVLGALCRQRRTRDYLSLRDVAKITGVSASTLSRLENGKTVELDHLKTLADWLEISVERIVPGVPEDIPTRIKALLLSDPKLDKDEAEALCRIFIALYRQMAK